MTELDWYTNIRTQQFAYSYQRTVFFDDPDTNVKMQGEVIDLRVNHNYRPNELEILIDFNGFRDWQSVLYTVISIEQEDL